MTSYYPVRGGYSGSDVFCGTFFVVISHGSNTITWDYGAALSFRLSTHYAFHSSPADYGVMGGTFFVVVAVVSTNVYWRLGAAL